MEEKILEVKNLKVVLENEIVINNLSFELYQGEILTILGPNGAGKSVLLKTLLNLLNYEGEVIWLKKVKIGYVPQRLAFIKDLPITLEEFLRLKEKDINKIEEILSYLNIEKKELRKRIGDFSSGQYQKILIAFSLLSKPDVLFFDEPTAGVDVSSEETIYHLLAKLNQKLKLTIVLITHDLSIVYKFSHRVICLNKKMICYGRPIDVLDKSTLEKLYGQEIKIYFHH